MKESLEMLLDQLVLVGSLRTNAQTDLRLLAETVTEIGNRVLELEERIPKAPVAEEILGLVVGDKIPPGWEGSDVYFVGPKTGRLRLRRYLR